jgi:hypothetical protein
MKGIVLLINKWDLVEKDSNTMNEYTRRLQADLKFIDYGADALHLGVDQAAGAEGDPSGAACPGGAHHAHSHRGAEQAGAGTRRSSTGAPSKTGKQLRIYYASQVEVAPPTFMFFVNDVELVHFTYRALSGESDPHGASLRRHTHQTALPQPDRARQIERATWRVSGRMNGKRVDPRRWLRLNWLELLILLALVVACTWLLTAGQASGR